MCVCFSLFVIRKSLRKQNKSCYRTYTKEILDCYPLFKTLLKHRIKIVTLEVYSEIFCEFTTCINDKLEWKIEKNFAFLYLTSKNVLFFIAFIHEDVRYNRSVSLLIIILSSSSIRIKIYFVNYDRLPFTRNQNLVETHILNKIWNDFCTVTNHVNEIPIYLLKKQKS